MAEETKKKPEWINFTTPKAKLIFMNFVTPDKKFKKFGATPLIDPVKDKEFIDYINKLNSDLFDELIVTVTKDREDYRVKKTFREDFTKDAAGVETPTGFLRFKVTSNSKKPTLDATGKKVIPDATLVKMWSGTQGKLRISAKPFIDEGKQRIGYVFYLQAAQIIDPVWGTSGNGFEEEEGGYCADNDDGGFGDETGGTPPVDADGKPKGDF